MLLCCTCKVPSDLMDSSLVGAIGIGVAILTFIGERYLSKKRKEKEVKSTWFLNIILEPNLDEITSFYEDTYNNLITHIGLLKRQKEREDYSEFIFMKSQYMDDFKNQRKLFFNNFVLMVQPYDSSLSLEIDRTLNVLQDFYIETIDNDNEYDYIDDNNLKRTIFENKAKLYSLLFSIVSQNSN